MPTRFEYHQFETCEKCGEYPAIYRWFCKKTLCSECSDAEFKKFIKKLLAGTASIGLIVAGFFIF